MRYLIFFLFLLLNLNVPVGFAKPKSVSKSNFLDFEDDKIGGRGDVLFGSAVASGKGAKIESLLYLRKDFNEFYRLEFGKGDRRGLQRKRLNYGGLLK